jgi:spermidine/putrescine ABC transporter ATP-binding subunit
MSGYPADAGVPAAVGLSGGASVRIDGVRKSYGSVEAVRNVSLEVGVGEFVSLLGPSGSGKTTLLMMIAGFELPDAGSIHVGDHDVTRVEPNERNLGMVFQRYALFPHLSVAENIAFPLRMRKLERAHIARKVQEALERVRLAGYDARKPDQLSGGQQQRVALARATVFDPPVILMDEPLGALDKKLREQMQLEIKHLQRELGSTVIYVTHDQQEALTMSDRVAVMSQGRIEQVSSPRALYNHPVSAFVADFVGDTNWLHGLVQAIHGTEVVLMLPGGETVRGLMPQQLPVNGPSIRVGESARLCIRPEQLEYLAPQQSHSQLEICITDEIYAGADLTLAGTSRDGQPLRLRIGARGFNPQLGANTTVQVSWRTEDAVVFPVEDFTP